MSQEAPQVYFFSERYPAPEQYRELQRTDTVFSGALNDNWVYSPTSDASSDRYVLRVPKEGDEQEKVVQAIRQEYDGIGATAGGVDFRLRSILEQIAFIDHLTAHGLKTIRYLDSNQQTILFPFLDGQPLHEYAEEADSNGAFQTIDAVLTHLTHAHENGIVFGDRWCTNTMVFPDGDFVELDYDLELIGERKTIKSFEIAQTLYFLTHFAGENRVFVTGKLSEFLRNNADRMLQYDLEKVAVFLSGHADFFHESPELLDGKTPPYNEIHALADIVKHIAGQELEQV